MLSTADAVSSVAALATIAKTNADFHVASSKMNVPQELCGNVVSANMFFGTSSWITSNPMTLEKIVAAMIPMSAPGMKLTLSGANLVHKMIVVIVTIPISAASRWFLFFVSSEFAAGAESVPTLASSSIAFASSADCASSVLESKHFLMAVGIVAMYWIPPRAFLRFPSSS